MQEKNPDHIPRPGVPEALDPDIGNGALWESDPHQLMLRSVDPMKKLDNLLVDESTREMILNRWNNNSEITIKENLFPLQTETSSIKENEKEMVIPNPKEKQTGSGIKVKKTKKNKGGQENQPLIKESEKTPDPPLPVVPEPKESQAKIKSKDIGKVGKRVRKVVKKVQAEQDRRQSPENPAAEASSVDDNLSLYTQWLKHLRGSEYVHPFEDDYALGRMSATARGGVSETFADLLAAQGYKEQAMEMYMGLMEKYPEKSSFFAAKIEALK